MKIFKFVLLGLLIIAIFAGSVFLFSLSGNVNGDNGNSGVVDNLPDNDGSSGSNNGNGSDNVEEKNTPITMDESGVDWILNNFSFYYSYSDVPTSDYLISLPSDAVKADVVECYVGDLDADGIPIEGNKLIIHVPHLDLLNNPPNFFGFSFENTGNYFMGNSFGAPEALLRVGYYNQENEVLTRLDVMNFSGGRPTDDAKYWFFEKPNILDLTLTDIIITIDIFANF